MAERSRGWGGLRRVGAGALILAALAWGLTACGDANDERARENCDGGAACAVAPTSTVAAAPVDLQLRPVLSTTAASIADNPCPTDLPVPVPSEIVVSPGCADGVIDVLYGLGPSLLDGAAIESARAVDSPGTGEWVVNPVFRQGPTGIDLFNAAAAHCNAQRRDVPHGAARHRGRRRGDLGAHDPAAERSRPTRSRSRVSRSPRPRPRPWPPGSTPPADRTEVSWCRRGRAARCRRGRPNRWGPHLAGRRPRVG